MYIEPFLSETCRLFFYWIPAMVFLEHQQFPEDPTLLKPWSTVTVKYREVM